MNKKKRKTRIRKKKKYVLTPKQMQFVADYTDINSPTYNNGTKSYMKNYNSHSVNGAASAASILVRSPKIQSAIQEIMEKNQFGVQDRIALLADIAKGRRLRKSTTVERDKDGKKTREYEHKIEPSATEIGKVIDIANKMDGTYAQADAVADLAKDEFKDMRKKLFKDAEVIK